MGSIRVIPEGERNFLKSAYRIGGACDCVEQLVYNSLDAGASCIAVRVNFERRENSKIQVIDNGAGVHALDMQILGTKYASSKLKLEKNDWIGSNETFGFRGESLAAIASVCNFMEITSRGYGQWVTTWSKCFKKGVASSPKRVKDSRSCRGTSVVVYDLFHSLPVRKNIISPNVELEWVVDRITALSIAFPTTSFTLRNDFTGEILLRTERTDSYWKTFEKLFTSAYPYALTTLPDVEFAIDSCSFGTVRECAKNVFRFHFSIGCQGHHSPDLQFILINNRPIFQTDFHRLLRNIFSNSTISKPKKRKEFKAGAYLYGSSGVEGNLHAVYALKILCRREETSMTNDGGRTILHLKNCVTVMQKLAEVTKNWLEENNLILDDEKMKKEMEGFTGWDWEGERIEEAGWNGSPRSHRHAAVSRPITPIGNSPNKSCLSEEEDTDLNSAFVESPAEEEPDEFSICHHINQWTEKTDRQEAEVVKKRLAKIENEPWDGADARQRSQIKFDPGIFASAKVIGQFEDSVIIALVKQTMEEGGRKFLIAIDQHAAHERVWLEYLCQEMIPSQISPFVSVPLASTEDMKLERNELRIIQSHLDYLVKLGFNATIIPEWRTVQILSVPVCLHEKEEADSKRGFSQLRRHIRTVLNEIIQNFRETQGKSNLTLPVSLRKILDNQACRRAVKFKEVLTQNQMEDLVWNLALCKYPFACAHGRPTVIPLVDMGT